MSTVGGAFGMMDIPASALRAERARMNVLANNVANVDSLTDKFGNYAPYRRKRIFFKEGAPSITGSRYLGVQVDKIDEDRTNDLKKIYMPEHKFADDEGYVAFPNVDIHAEMVDMMVAARAFEANLTSMESAKQILRGALQIIA